MEPNDGASGLDVIRLVGLGGVGRHGVLEEERREGQTFLVDLALHLDTSEAAALDAIDRTVNYADVAASAIALIEGEPVQLIETLAARIAEAVLGYELVHSVEVTVHKPEAPVGVPFTDVQVSIRRGKTSAGGAGVLQAEPVAGAAPAPVAPAPAAPAALAVPAAAAANEGVPAPEPAQEGNGHGANLDRAPDGEVEVVLALGGNVGDVRATMRAVVADLREAPGLDLRTVSPLARTAAVLEADAVAQQDYLNAVVLATTTLSPNALLELTQSLENSYGRRRQERWGERTLDIDLITYDGVTSSEEHLALPHPRANERAFVLVPWAQADPDAFLPGLGGGPVAILAETAPDRSGVRWLALDWLEDTGNRTDSGSFVLAAQSGRSESAEPDVPAPAEAPQDPEPAEQASLAQGSASGEPEPSGPVSKPEVPAQNDPAQQPEAPGSSDPAQQPETSAQAEPSAAASSESSGAEAADAAVSGSGAAAVAEPVALSTPERGVETRQAEPAVIEPETGMPPAFAPDEDDRDQPSGPDPQEPPAPQVSGVPQESPAPQVSAAPQGEPARPQDTGDGEPEPDIDDAARSQEEAGPEGGPVADSEAAQQTSVAEVAPESRSGVRPEGASGVAPKGTEDAHGTVGVAPEGAEGVHSSAGVAPEDAKGADGSAEAAPEGTKGSASSDFRPRWQPLRGDQDT